MSRWWRAYDEAVDDPKLRCLSDESFRFWFNLCCVCSKFGGNLPEIKHLAFVLKMQRRKVERLMSVLREEKLIDEDNQGIRPHNWKNRQYKSDGSTERVKRFRNVSAAVSETGPEYRVQSTDTERKISCSNEFERFWKAYPRRVGKKAAEKALAKALRETSIDAILGAIARQTSSWTDPQFVPHPATWLNRGSWSDGEEPRVVKEFVPGPGMRTDEEIRRDVERRKAEESTGTGADVLAPKLCVHDQKSNGLDFHQAGHAGVRRMGEIFSLDEMEAVRAQDD